MRVLVFLGAMLVANIASATTFGDSVYANTYIASGCADSIALSMPVAVSVSSRIYVSARASFSPSGTTLTLGTVGTVLRASSGGGALAESEVAWSGTPDNAFADSNGILHTPGSKSNPQTQIYVAEPGNYILEMHVAASNGTCAGSPTFEQPTLTYLLLSSVFDRVYADGFEAMLGDGKSVGTVA